MNGWSRTFLLHTRPYRETSLFLDCLTENYGRITILVNKFISFPILLKGILRPFVPLLIQWSGKGEIKKFVNVEPISISFPLAGMMLYSGLYLNELLSRVLVYEISDSSLFHKYLQCLCKLSRSNDSPEPALRSFELFLLKNLGYESDFFHCAKSGEPVNDLLIYRYLENNGFVLSFFSDSHSFIGKDLKAIAEEKFHDIHILRSAKRFTRLALRPFLGEKPLKSRELFYK